MSSEETTRWSDEHASARIIQVASEAIEQATAIIPEIEALHNRLEQRMRRYSPTGLQSLLSQLHRDLDILRRTVEDLENAQSQGTSWPSDQIKTYEKTLDYSAIPTNQAYLQWSVLRRCHSLLAVNSAFCGSTYESRQTRVLEELQKYPHGKPSGAVAPVRSKRSMNRDIKTRDKVEASVVDWGAEWIAIRPITSERLARLMNDAGWAWGEYDDPAEDVDPDEWDTVLLAVQTRRLVEAARANRHNYSTPRVRLVLPNVGRGVNADIDVFLAQLTRMDPEVQLTVEDANSPFLTDDLPPLDTCIENLAGDELAELTPTLNLDHSTLVDLISDLTHCRLTPQPWQPGTTRAQIEEENRSENGAMVSALYPILRGRKLVCTSEAARHFHKLLLTVGTPTERERGHLLIPEDSPPDDLRERFASLSIHPLPADLQLPITVLDTQWDAPSAIPDAVANGTLPAVAVDIVQQASLAASKLSVFMHGWSTGMVTVTSNREIHRRFRTLIGINRKNRETAGPHIYTVHAARNLLSKSATPPPGWQGERAG